LPLKTQNVPSLGSTPPTSDIIAKHIREAIFTGELDEHEPIRQDDIAKLFDVSQVPVREALKRLEAEGLVEFQRNRGAVVTSITEPQIAESFEVRGMLEANALKRSVTADDRAYVSASRKIFRCIRSRDQRSAVGGIELAVSLLSLRGCRSPIPAQSNSIRERPNRALPSHPADLVGRHWCG
jgi:DNA-binding GntR family transcriptional regulator